MLDAATTLFAARGPASVAVRDIAAAARVNHALVHRHFGSKQEVWRAVLERAVKEIAVATNEIADRRISLQQRFKLVAEHEDYWRALARAILDHEDPRTPQREFPNVRRCWDYFTLSSVSPARGGSKRRSRLLWTPGLQWER